MDSITQLAKLLRERDNQSVPSITLGTVIKAPPEVEIRLNDVIVLKKDRLIFSAHMLNGNSRETKLNGDIKFTDTNAGATNSVNDGGYQANSHSHTIATLNVDTTFESKATLEMTDTIKEGDQVIIMPTVDEQLYVVIDKAVRLE